MASFPSLNQTATARLVIIWFIAYFGSFAVAQADGASQGAPTHHFFLTQSKSFFDVTQKLTTELQRECAVEKRVNPLSESEKSSAAYAIRRQVNTVMLGWMPLQGIVSGPAAASDRYWQVQFWPDKKNTTGRQLTVLLKQNRAWQLEWLVEQSVAAQGLGALEWLWFDEQAKTWSFEQRCQASQVIAANLSQNAKSIYMAWQENPWRELNNAQWKAEALSLMVDQLDLVMKKMALPLGKNGKTKPFFSEAWRSQTSLVLLKTNLTQLEAQFWIPKSGVRALLQAQKQDVLAERIAKQFKQILADWPTKRSLVNALNSQEGHRAMIQRYNQVEHLHYLLSEPAANALGVLVGFNATDGD
ncbi:imelysin family protein [Vibrio sp. SM6]|uniref:Imelysin family protein n=1 Tax=Vibrio agarilyticus TaxID=2726741 RepID=A0A7X8TUY1_9VIBR|nr:imelysin family protein [Vibrio agarilyticus]NLS14803.1 imelysin family protein [Vibrio agarilyticus]